MSKRPCNHELSLLGQRYGIRASEALDDESLTEDTNFRHLLYAPINNLHLNLISSFHGPLSTRITSAVISEVPTHFNRCVDLLLILGAFAYTECKVPSSNLPTQKRNAPGTYQRFAVFFFFFFFLSSFVFY